MKIMSIMLVVLMVLPSMSVLAGEMEDPITGAIKTVSRAAVGTVETAVSPIEALSKGEPENIIVDPVKKAGKTIVTATEDTGKTLTAQKVD